MLLTLLQACTSGEPTVPREVAARQATFATLAALGSFRLEWSIETATRFGDGPPETSTVATRLAWAPEAWSYERLRGGEVLSELRVVGGRGWERRPGPRYEPVPDVEPLRATVAHGWDPWREVVGAHEEQLSLTSMGIEEVEGRRVERFRVSLGATPPKRGRGQQLVSAEGDVWIDEATAVRLQARVQLGTEARGQRTDTTLLLAMTGIGAPQGVTAPVTP